MKRILFFVVFIVAIAVWCTPSFAAQQLTAGAGDKALNGTGILNGVEFQTPTVTTNLIVGANDIFTSNSALTSPLPAVWTDTASQGSIQFDNSSTVYGDVGQTGAVLLNINSIAAGTTINFRGAVYATTLNVGTGTVNFDSGGLLDKVTNTILAGDGTISLAAGTKVTNGGGLTTTVAAAAGTGTLSLGSGSHWAGAVGGGAFMLKEVNVDGGSTAGVSATITGAVDAHSFNLGTNTLNILGGALSLNNDAAGGVIKTTIAGTGSTQYGHILASAGAFTAGALTVNVTVPSGTYIPLGQLFNIVNALSSPGGYVVTVAVNNPLYTFEASPVGGTAADGLVTIKSTGNPITASKTSTDPVAPIAAVVADALLTLPTTSDIVVAINALTTADAVANAEAQLAPSTPSLVAPLVTFQGAREFQNLWLSYLEMCSQVSTPDEEKSTCEGKKATSGWWAKGFGYFGQQNDRGAFPGYDSTIAGTMVAYDVPLGQDTRAGLGFGYARSTIDGHTYDTNTAFDTYQTTAYIGHDQGPWFVHGSASFGWNEYSDRRHIVFTGVDRTANAEYSGQDYTTFVNTGYHFSAPMKFTITPFASLQYSRVNIDSYTDKGAGDADLHVKPQGYDFLESGLGVKVERDFTFHSLTLVPEIHLEWLHELSNPALEQTADYTVGSASFTTPGLKTSPDTFHAGTSLALLSCMCSKTKLSLEVGYDYYLRHDGYSANQVTMRVTGRF